MLWQTAITLQLVARFRISKMRFSAGVEKALISIWYRKFLELPTRTLTKMESVSGVTWTPTCWKHSVNINKIGRLSSDDGNCKKNVTWKYNFNSFVLRCDYFNLLNFYRNGGLPRNQIGRGTAQDKKENEKFTVVWSHSPKKPRIWSFHIVVLQRTAKKCTKM